MFLLFRLQHEDQPSAKCIRIAMNTNNIMAASTPIMIIITFTNGSSLFISKKIYILSTEDCPTQDMKLRVL